MGSCAKAQEAALNVGTGWIEECLTRRVQPLSSVLCCRFIGTLNMEYFIWFWSNFGKREKWVGSHNSLDKILPEASQAQTASS